MGWPSADCAIGKLVLSRGHCPFYASRCGGGAGERHRPGGSRPPSLGAADAGGDSRPLAGASAVFGDFWRFSRAPAVVVSAHMVGEHNEDALTGPPGYSEAEAQAIATMTLNGQAIAGGAEVEAPLKYRGNETTVVATPPEPPPDETTDSETTHETVEEATCAEESDRMKAVRLHGDDEPRRAAAPGVRPQPPPHSRRRFGHLHRRAGHAHPRRGGDHRHQRLHRMADRPAQRQCDRCHRQRQPRCHRASGIPNLQPSNGDTAQAVLVIARADAGGDDWTPCGSQRKDTTMAAKSGRCWYQWTTRWRRWRSTRTRRTM